MRRFPRFCLLALGLAGIAAAIVEHHYNSLETNVWRKSLPGLVYDVGSAERARPVAFAIPSLPYRGGLEFSFSAVPADMATGPSDIFQTAPYDKGLRMEVDSGRTVSVVAGSRGKEQTKEFFLYKSLAPNKPVLLRVRYEFSGTLQVFMDGQKVLDAADSNMRIALSAPLVGGGYDAARRFKGTISSVDIRCFEKGPPWGELTGALISSVKYCGLAALSLLVYGFFVGLLRGGSSAKFPVGTPEVSEPHGGLVDAAFRRFSAMLSLFWPHTASLFLLAVIPAGWLLLSVPAYPDEFGFQLINARAMTDKFLHSSVFPICLSACSLPMPWFWRPARFLYEALYSPVTNLIVFRCMGIAAALCAAGGTMWLLAKALSSRGVAARHIVFFVSAGCFAGVLPLVLILNRPEILLVFCMAWFTVVPFLGLAAQSKTKRIVLLLASVALLGLFFMLHPKSLLFLPLLLVSAWVQVVCIWGRKAAVAASCVVLLFWAQSYRVYARSSKCPESSTVELINSKQYLMPGPAARLYPLEYGRGLLRNLAGYNAYLTSNTFNDGYAIDWLPPVPKALAPWGEVLNLAMLTGFNYMLAVSCIFLFLRLLRGWRFLKGDKGEGLLPFALALSLAGLCAIQTSKNFYEAAFIIPVVIVLFCVSCMTVPDWEKALPYAGVLFYSVPLFAAASAVLAVLAFLPPLLKGYHGPSLSVVNYSSSLTDENMRMARERCGVSERDSHLLLDDLTYMHFKKTFQPYGLSYLSLALSSKDPSLLTDDAALAASLKKLDIHGVVAFCSRLETMPLLRRKAVREGNVCCVGPAGMESIYAGKYR